jgi:hypothetical protein
MNFIRKWFARLLRDALQNEDIQNEVADAVAAAVEREIQHDRRQNSEDNETIIE